MVAINSVPLALDVFSCFISHIPPYDPSFLFIVLLFRIFFFAFSFHFSRPFCLPLFLRSYVCMYDFTPCFHELISVFTRYFKWQNFGICWIRARPALPSLPLSCAFKNYLSIKAAAIVSKTLLPCGPLVSYFLRSTDDRLDTIRILRRI